MRVLALPLATRDGELEEATSSAESECADRSSSLCSIERSKRKLPLSPPPSQHQQQPKPRALRRKPRKSTHAVRKEEKRQLLHEMAHLQAQIDTLKRRVFGVSTSTNTGSTKSSGNNGSTSQASELPRLADTVLRAALQQQFAQFADAQVLFSAIGMTQVISPIALPIRLGRDRRERLATLEAIRAKRLAISRAFLTRRCSGLDPRLPYSEDQRFETPLGDYCAVRFGNMQFRGVPSVRHVFDLLWYYYRNIEINISEKLGSLTIREDDDHDHVKHKIAQNRLVTASATARGQLIESNTILFSDFVDAHESASGESYGLIAAEFVDNDALYPYRPDQRVRKDISMILQLTSHTQRVETAAGGVVDELVVVLTRWSHSRLHRPTASVSKTAMHALREGMAKWCESMHQTLRESLFPDL